MIVAPVDKMSSGVFIFYIMRLVTVEGNTNREGKE